MPPPNEAFVTDRGARVALRLEKELGSGNYGTVYRLGRPYSNDVLKIYNDTKYAQDVEAKVDFMLSNRPADATVKDKGRLWHQLAWPQRKAVDRHGLFVGYTMPEIDENESECLHLIFSETERKAHNIPEHYGFRLIVARNLAAVFDNLHSVGICILDVKPDNIRFYKESGYICLLDCDSFIPTKGSALAAGAACTAGYILPEATVSGPVDDPSYQVAHFRYKQDDFALSILIFRLMNDGYHPFSGVPKSRRMRGLTEQERIFAGGYSFGSAPNSEISPPPLSLHKWLDASTRAMFDRAFASRNRPTASDWLKHLDRFVMPGSKDFVRCAVNSKHMHFQMGCGLCAREQALSKLRARAAPQVPIRTPPARSPGPAAVAAPRPAQLALLNPHPAPALPVPPPPPLTTGRVGKVIGWTVGIFLLFSVVSCVRDFFKDLSRPVVTTTSTPQPRTSTEPYSPPYYANPSFPCTGDLSWQQRAICSDEALAAQDRELASLSQEVDGNSEEVQRVNKRWSEEWDRCGGSGSIPGCLGWVYREWLEDLRGIKAAAFTYTVRPFSPLRRYIITSTYEAVLIQRGPGRDYDSTGRVHPGDEVTGRGSTVGEDGVTWISVTAANGASGFIMEHLLQATTGGSGAREANSTSSSAGASGRIIREAFRPPSSSESSDAVEVRRSPRRQPDESSDQQYAEPPRGSTCILPSGQEVQLSEQRCRDSSGVIYR